MLKLALAAVCLTIVAGCASHKTAPAVPDMNATSSTQPPQSPREFRAVWVATVANIDWPSKPGLPSDQQQKEAIAILDKCVELNLNAVILQVRTSCDALYDSKYEPWSYFLTGEQGKAPEPYYDPLKFWCDEAHKRGLQLHAWFNPYRAKSAAGKYEASANHISKTNPSIVKSFNGWEWLDPSEQASQDLTYNVFMDVATRYDVDGLHIDDYFYPYPEYLKNADFPDDDSWQRYQASGGKLSRADWRRDSVNKLIHRIYMGLKSQKPHVQFGISPFGLPRAGRIPGVTGFDQYEKLYADTQMWLEQGWLDYWTPQLYWKISAPQQGYVDLLTYWSQHNPKKRNLWPGLFTSRLGEKEPHATTTTTDTTDDVAHKEYDREKKLWTLDSITDQIIATRHVPGASGEVHFSAVAFTKDMKGINEALKNGVYKYPALVPTSPWLDKSVPEQPHVTLQHGRDATVARVMKSPTGEEPLVWSVYTREGDKWIFHTYPASESTLVLKPSGDPPITEVSVAAVNRLGNESTRALVMVQK